MEKNFEVLHEAINTLKNTDESLSEKLFDLVKKLEEKIEANKLEEVIDTEKEIQEFVTQHETEINQEGSVQKIKNEIEWLKKQVAQDALKTQEWNNNDPSNDVHEGTGKKWRWEWLSDGWKSFLKWTGFAALATAAYVAVVKLWEKTTTEWREILTGEYTDPLRGAGKEVSSPFGVDRGDHTHKGTDIAANEWTPIYAAAPGKVARIDFESWWAGHYIVIEHPNGDESKYFHLQRKSPLRAWDPVTTDTIIGWVGNTGHSRWPTGMHLHFEVRKNGQPVDPDGCCAFAYEKKWAGYANVA